MSAYKLGETPGAEVIRHRVQGTRETPATIHRRRYPMPVVVEVFWAALWDVTGPARRAAFPWALLLIFFATVGAVWFGHTLGWWLR